MIALLEAMFGSKVGRICAEVLLAVALLFGVYKYVEHKGAAQEIAALKASSAKVQDAAAKQIAANDAAHAAAVKTNEEKTNAAIQANVVTAGKLADSVRSFDAYRRTHGAVASPGSGPSAASAGECGVEDCGAVAVRLAQRGNELAGSLGDTTAVLQGCQRERDSLTGMPR
jgi:hypothetical protein